MARHVESKNEKQEEVEPGGDEPEGLLEDLHHSPTSQCVWEEYSDLLTMCILITHSHDDPQQPK